MTDTELKDFLKSRKDYMNGIEIEANYIALLTILVTKGIITMEEFDKAKERSVESALDIMIKKLTEDERKSIELAAKMYKKAEDGGK